MEVQTLDNPERETKRKHLIIRSYSPSFLGYGKQMLVLKNRCANPKENLSWKILNNQEMDQPSSFSFLIRNNRTVNIISMAKGFYSRLPKQCKRFPKTANKASAKFSILHRKRDILPLRLLNLD
jgi:hypothetical protein